MSFLQRKDTIVYFTPSDDPKHIYIQARNGPSTWDMGFLLLCVYEREITECQEIEHVWSLREEKSEGEVEKMEIKSPCIIFN